MLSLFAALLVAAGPPATVKTEDPPVRIWLNNDRRFEQGDRAKVQIRADYDGYLLVLHVDPDGRLRVLFPLDPTDDNFVRGDRKYEIRGRGDRESFTAEGQGRGTVFAALSRDAFHFEQYVTGDHWDYRALNPNPYPQDPESDLTELTRRMAGGRFDYDIVSYDVYAPNRVAYDDGSYTPGYTAGYGSRAYLYDPYCDPFFDRWCGGYGYGSGFHLAIGFGRGHRFYDRFYDPIYRPIYYDPFYDPWRPYYYPPRYYGSYYPYHRGYWDNPRYITPGYRPYDFKQRDRVWSTPYRDRLRQVNTVYQPFPAQGRGVELSMPLRRRSDDAVAGPGRGVGETFRGGRGAAGAGSAEPRRRTAEPVAEPRLQPRGEPIDARRAEPRREAPRAEPRQEQPRPEPRAQPRPEPRAEPRREAPPQMDPRPAPRAEPRAEPRAAPQVHGGGGGGGGGRRRT